MANDVINYKKFDITGIGSWDSMDAIIDTIPILNMEQERGLIVDYRHNGNVESAKKLVIHSLRYIRSVALGYIKYGFRLPDLLHEGVIGLMVALNRYDLKYEVPLIGYATGEIKNHILTYVMRYSNTVSIPDSVGEGGKHVNRTLFYRLKPTISKAQMVEGTSNITPSVLKAVSEELGVSQDAILAFMQRTQVDFRYDSLDDQDDQDDDHVYSWEPTTETLEGEMIQEEHSVILQRTLEAIDELDQRSKEILLSRYTGERISLSKLADRFGVSIERVRQIEQKAIQTIKTKMELQNV